MHDPLQSALVSARVKHKAGEGTTFYTRSHALTIRVPMTFDIAEPGLSAVEQFIAAICADVLGGFARMAKQMRLRIDQLEATVDAQISDALVYLGVVGETGSPRLTSLRLKAWIDSGETAERISAAWEEALRRAPLVQTLSGSALQLDLSWQLV